MSTLSPSAPAPIGGLSKRPPFSVEYFNDQVAALPDREREHRKQQFKALLGFDSYSEFLRDFYRRPATYWALLQRGPHVPPSQLLAPFLQRDTTLFTQPRTLHHTKLAPIDEFSLPFRKLASLATNVQLAADYDISTGHIDALMLNVATLAAVFWAPEYLTFGEYLRLRGANPMKLGAQLQGLDDTLFDYLKHAMIRKRRMHAQLHLVSDYIIFQQAELIAALDVKNGIPPADPFVGSAGPLA